MNRNTISTIALLLVFLAYGYAPAAADSVPDTGGGPEAANATDKPMTLEEEFDHPCERFTLGRIEIRKLVEDIKQIYADEPVTLRRILKAQAAWDTYVIAHSDALYGGPESYGSIADFCNCINLLPIVELRLQQLRYWRDGTVEGDVCAGHVKWLQKE